MNNTVTTQFFLGANSSCGFVSLYDDFVSPDRGDFLWILKGGPGCGKSTFMRKIAHAAAEHGLDTELICCSGDPESLDGVYIPALKLGYADGTSPHVMDSVYPAARSMYLDLGSFYDHNALKAQYGEISALFRSYKAKYARAYDLLSAAGSTAVHRTPGLVTEKELDSVRRRADSFISRELGRGAPSAGIPKKRFISAVSCLGEVFLDSTVAALCPRICVLDNSLGMADTFLSRAAEGAARRGTDYIICPDPMFPDRLEALLLPQHGLALLARSERLAYGGETYRHFRLDAMADRDRIAASRSALRRSVKLQRALTDEAIKELAGAKLLHDRLERVYNPYVDFSGVSALAQRHIEQIF